MLLGLVRQVLLDDIASQIVNKFINLKAIDSVYVISAVGGTCRDGERLWILRDLVPDSP